MGERKRTMSVTVGEMREMCEGLSDDTPVLVLVPGGEGENDWRSVEFDISAHLFPDRCFFIEVPDPGSGR